MSCCASDKRLTKVTCGRGTSCIGQCSAIEASLCPSGRCTGDPDDCNLSNEEGRRREGGDSDATIDSQELRKCYPACKVRHIPACCFHPDCHSLRPKLCNKMNYFSSKLVIFFRILLWLISGNSCPKPGSIPNGIWSCQMQEIPIPDATFLDGDANTFPGKNIFLFCFVSLQGHCRLTLFEAFVSR